MISITVFSDEERNIVVDTPKGNIIRVNIEGTETLHDTISFFITKSQAEELAHKLMCEIFMMGKPILGQE